MKTCGKCGVSKRHSEYYKNKGVCKKCYSTREALRYHENKTNYLQRTYDLTLEEWNSLYVKQNGQCACCNTHIKATDIHTDHNHDTLKVRGLLCSGCNTGLGMFGDSPSRLQKAYNYLMREGYYGEH